MHVIEFYSRKQKQVRKSTLGAEQGAMVDGINTGIVIAVAMQELLSGPLNPAGALDVMSGARPLLPVEAVTDAKSLFDSLARASGKTPVEETLVFGLQYLQDLQNRGLLRRSWWVDTRDMVSDALTKGVISRKSIVQLVQTGTWRLAHTCERYDSVVAPIDNSNEAPNV